MISKTNQLAIGDFGLAVEFKGENLRTSNVVGTPYYCSPEILLIKMYSKSSEMWSYGLLIYFILFKERFFNCESME